MSNGLYAYEIGSCVLAARMNPSIVMPLWLHKNNICSTSEAAFNIKLESSGLSYAFMQDGFQWECSQTQLVVSSIDGNKNPGDYVSKVIGLLTHTPVSACGNNFRYAVSDEIQRDLGNTLYTKMRKQLSATNHNVVDTSIKYGISHSDATIWTEFVHGEDRVVALFFNFHRETETASVAKEAAGKWKSDREASESIASDILKGCTHG